MNNWICFACSLMVGFTAVAAPQTYTVRPGDDLAAVVARIRAARASTKTPCVLELVDGTYLVSKTIELDARDDGITIRSAKGAHPVLDGGTRVTGFKPFRDGIFVADVSRIPCVREPFFCYGGIGLTKDENRVIDLYRDGAPLIVAREPDAGFFKTGKVANAGDFVFACPELERLGCRGEKGMLATGYWRYLWADETFSLAAQGTGLWKLDVAQGIPGKSNYRDLQPNMPFFACNSLKFLNRDCEWVLDREQGKLYVKGRPNAEYVLTTLAGPLLRIKGATDVRIEGLTFRYGRGNGIEANGCRALVFRDNVVERFGGTGVVCANAKDCVLEGNLLRTFGYKAASLNGGNRATLTASGCVFSDNEVTDTGRLRRTYSHGVAISGCGVQVVRNYFHDLPSSSICMPGNNHFIASNITERAVLESDDQGGIDIFGSPFFQGNRVVHNVWRDIGRAATGLNATCGKAGVRLDDQVSGFYIYGNRFDNCSGGHFGGVQIHGGRDNDVVNNVFTRCKWAVSFSPWNRQRWQQHWYPNCKSPETINVFSPVWKAQYGDLMRLRNMGNVNRITRNLVIGAEALTNGRCQGEAVLKDNVLLPAGSAIDYAKILGFEPLPPESALGPRTKRTKMAGVVNAWPKQPAMVRSTLDGTSQPCWFWAPERARREAVPLVVGLHTWSGDYRQMGPYRSVQAEAQRRGWAFVGPNFRGPNSSPKACGSNFAVQDILDAVNYAKACVKIDEARIYIIGGSGGGHMTLLMCGRHPEVFAAGAAFCPISDCARWHADSLLKHPGRSANYARMLVSACGGTPAEKPQEYRQRSPLTYLAQAKAAGVSVYIGTGIHDGWRGSVPVGHAIRAFNALADERDRIDEQAISSIERTQAVPAALAYAGAPDPFYAGKMRIHLRRKSANAQLTLFEGGHDINSPAGFDFLARQRKGRPADFTVPKSATGASSAVDR